ncbi:LRR receptor-like serine/threonine-protein kinase GSO1 [Populus alba x Populus x berolinensis]|nr:LRR receptor-like serine/threonine-protein kinase GSO1 [Populus alba x Populus x berolinensis]
MWGSALQAKVVMAKLFPKLVSFLAVLLLLCQFGYVVCQSTNPSDRNATLPPDEANALQDLLTTLGWFSPVSSFCSSDFQGIKCNCTSDNNNSTVCHVTGLDLSNRKLDGQINATALTSLVYLKTIDLSNNQLDGSIPVTMGNLPSLNYLDLSNNQLDGIILVTMGNLSALRYLDLSYNQLNGSIPVTMRNLPALRYLDLSNNQLDGSIPVTMGNLLRYLRLSTNFLSGSIPPLLGNLSSLEYLSLKYNMLSGEIPKELGKLSNLQEMYLGFNELTGQLPPELGRLGSLYALDVGSNNLSGELPENYANFSTLDQLRWFSVAGNRLTGQVPRFIANWTGLSFLFLSGNDFEGELPLEPLFNMSYLRILFVSDVRSSAGFPFPKNASMTGIRYLKQGLIWNGICGRITERQRWLSEGERAGSRFSRGVVLSVDLEGLVRVCGGWSVKAGDGAVGSAVRDRERKMRKCSGRLCGCGGELEG